MSARSCEICGLAFTRDVKARELPRVFDSLSTTRFACESHFAEPERVEWVPGPNFPDADARAEIELLEAVSELASMVRDLAAAMLAEKEKRDGETKGADETLGEQLRAAGARACAEVDVSGAGSSPAGDATKRAQDGAWPPSRDWCESVHAAYWRTNALDPVSELRSALEEVGPPEPVDVVKLRDDATEACANVLDCEAREERKRGEIIANLPARLFGLVPARRAVVTCPACKGLRVDLSKREVRTIPTPPSSPSGAIPYEPQAPREPRP